jgi:hypothetical protein
MTPAKPVAPDAVHVWRGYRAAGKSIDDFATFLGTVFVPACALLQPNAGLHAFIPSLPSPAGKPPTVPDQTALMFWTDQGTYANAFKTLAVRAYTNLHGDAYGPPSAAAFPVALVAGPLTAEQPYYLIAKPADWMLGQVHHFIGARPGAETPAAFLAELGTWAGSYSASHPPGVDAAIICAGNDYVTFWQHSPHDVAEPAGAPDLTGPATPVLQAAAETVELGAGLWDDWPGLDLTAQPSLNIQLKRP